MNVVFLFDVDNTLVDNDRVAADLRVHLDEEVGEDCGRRYWQIFEELRAELGYADYLGALQRYRDTRPRDLRILTVSNFLVSYPFANRLYPGLARRARPLRDDRLDRDPERRRRRLPATQDPALGALRRGRRPRPRLHP